MDTEHINMDTELRPVPKQYKGAHSETSYTIKASGHAAAHYIFEKARRNLLSVNSWQAFAGASTAAFAVVNSDGEETGGWPKETDYLRIGLSSVPGTAEGKGYDWVVIESVKEGKGPGFEYIAMRVRPAVPPFYRQRTVAHFFSAEATSTFCIERRGRKIKAAIYGRNETPNTRSARFFSSLRNLVVAIGAMMGLNKHQWKSLVKGWLLYI